MVHDEKFYVIAVVEDNFADYVLFEEYLKEYMRNAQISNYENYAAFETYISKKDAKPDAIFLDLSLPDKSGEELIKEVLLHSKQTPVIVLTGNLNLDFAVNSLALGVNDYLMKDNLSSILIYKTIIYSIERNRTLQELKKSKKRYMDFFQLNPKAMLVYNGDNQQIVDANKFALDLYGYKHDEIKELKINDLKLGVTEDFSEREKFMNYIHEYQDLFNLEIHKRKNNQSIIVDIQKENVSFLDLNTKLIILEDVTASLERRFKLDLQNERIKEIAWTQSHLVRAPIARILGINEHILENELNYENEELNMLLKNMQSSVKELDDIIKTIISRANPDN